MSKKYQNYETNTSDEIEAPMVQEEPEKFMYIVKTEENKLLNVRSAPEVNPTNVIGTLKPGAEVEAVEKIVDGSKPFTEIKYNGGVAYVMTSKLV